MRYLPQYPDSKEAIERIRLASPTGERVSLAQLCAVQVSDGANEIYRERKSRYIAIKYSVRGRDLGSTVEEAIRKTSARVRLPGAITSNGPGNTKANSVRNDDSLSSCR